MIGQVLRHYRIEERLGAGGMGVVYRALDTHLDRSVAIKVLPASALADPGRRTRFVHEAKAASALSHPNIVTIHDIDTAMDGDHPVDYIAMEYVAGRTLDQLIGRKGLKVAEVLKYGSQIADALTAAHAAGIVHRDLKPANIMVTDHGLVKLLDFGLAKLTEPSEADVFAPTESVKLETEHGTILGTVAYMSPEQAEGHRVDARSDIFSFGAVLYEMATGKRPFTGDSKLSTLASILRQETPPVVSSSEPIPRELDRIIARCLKKSVQRRWQSMADIRVALDELHEEIESNHLAGADLVPSVPATSRRRWQWVWPVVALLALATGLDLGSLLLKKPPPSFQRLTFRLGDVNAAKFAPDGQTIVYSARWSGAPSTIFSTRIGNRESRSLDLPESKLLSISSTGEMAILLGINGPATLARVPLAGGAPREILENVSDADWSPDGTSLAVVHTVGRQHRVEFPIGRVLYQNDAPPLSVRVSPKGDAVAFFDLNAEAGDYSVVTVNLQGKKHVLSQGWRNIGQGMEWSPSGDEVWFCAAKTGGDSALRAVALSGKERNVIQTPVFMAIYDVARDGRVLIVAALSRIGISYFPDGKQERDLSWLDTSWLYDSSSDGKTILFTELLYGEGRNPAIYLRKTDGSPAVRMGDGVHPSLSPDGKWIVCTRNNANELVLLPTGAGEARQLTAQGMRYDRAEWFPDGRRILFTGSMSNHPMRTYAQSLDGGAPVPVTPEGVKASRVSPDQKSVVISAAGKFLLQPLSGGAPRAIAEVQPGDTVIRWSADGKFLYYKRAEGDAAATIYRLEIASGRSELARQLRPADPAGVTMRSVSITPDGSSYGYSFQRDLTNLYLGEGLK